MTPGTFYKQIDTLIHSLKAALGKDTDTVWNRVIMPVAAIIISDSQSLIRQAPHDKYIGSDQSIMSKKISESIPVYLHMFMVYRTNLIDEADEEKLETIMPVMIEVTIKLVDRALATFEETGTVPTIPPINTQKSSVDFIGNLFEQDPLQLSKFKP